MDQVPCSTATGTCHRKRQHSESSEDEREPAQTPMKMKPLTVQPIENEYENSDDDDDEERVEEEQQNGDELDQKLAATKRKEYQDILNAQEEATETSHGDIKITPFNLEEELEEGQFDVSGNYIFDREKKDDENNDAWAESVDWAAVEKRAKEEEERQKLAMQVEEEEAASESNEQVPDKNASYRRMLRLMRPDETVQKTIRRLGDAIPKRGKPQRASKTSQQPPKTEQVDPAKVDVKEARAKLDLMIELAHQRLEEGEVDIYQMSYEDLEEAIN